MLNWAIFKKKCKAWIPNCLNVVTHACISGTSLHSVSLPCHMHPWKPLPSDHNPCMSIYRILLRHTDPVYGHFGSLSNFTLWKSARWCLRLVVLEMVWLTAGSLIIRGINVSFAFSAFIYPLILGKTTLMWLLSGYKFFSSSPEKQRSRKDAFFSVA